MPWTVDDVERHKKGLTDKQKETWVKVANSALKRCMGKGGGQKECEGSAIRQANTAAGNVKEYDMAYRGYFTSGSATVEVRAIKVDGEAIPVAELVAAYQEQQGESQEDGKAEVQEDAMKTVDGKKYSASDFLVAEDSEKPTTWHLQVKRNGKPDHGLMGGAKAALTSPGGHRGNKYEGPGKEGAIKKLKALYKAEDMPWGKEETAEVDVDKVRGLLQEALSMLEMPTKVTGAQLFENALFDAFMPEGDHSAAIMEVVKEAGVTAGEGRRAPVVVDLQIIRPGPGNKKDKRYYPPETLQKYGHVFENADIFVTDHKADERGEKTKVGRIRQCPTRFMEDGAIVGRTIVYDPDMAEKIRNRADASELHTLHCSILGTGDVQPGKVDGKKYGIVKSINPNPLVEFVGKAGAGGKALSLAESDTGGVKMDKEQIEKLLSESDLPSDVQERLVGVEYEDEEAVKEAILKEQEQAQEEEAPQKLAEADVEEAVSATKLPEFARAALKAREYADEAELKEAIAGAVKEVAKLTGSGQPFAQGSSEQAGDKLISERDRIVEFNEIMEAVGGRSVPVPAEQ